MYILNVTMSYSKWQRKRTIIKSHAKLYTLIPLFSINNVLSSSLAQSIIAVPRFYIKYYNPIFEFWFKKRLQLPFHEISHSVFRVGLKIIWSERKTLLPRLLFTFCFILLLSFLWYIVQRDLLFLFDPIGPFDTEEGHLRIYPK